MAHPHEGFDSVTDCPMMCVVIVVWDTHCELTSAAGQQDVGSRQVSMQDVQGVQVGHGACNLDRRLQNGTQIG